MSSRLRSFFQFAPLERKLRQVTERSADWKDLVKTLAGPPLIEYELAKIRGSNGTILPASRLGACLELVTGPSKQVGELEQPDLLQFQGLLLNRPAEAVELRRGAGARLSEGHVCLDTAAVPRALARFFEWTASEAFAEMHAVEQMTLCQVRLYEIWPFEVYSELSADFFALRILYLRTSLLPLFRLGETSDFQAALSEAFRFVTKPLVDLYVRACERSCDEVLRQL